MIGVALQAPRERAPLFLTSHRASLWKGVNVVVQAMYDRVVRVPQVARTALQSNGEEFISGVYTPYSECINRASLEASPWRRMGDGACCISEFELEL